MPSLILTWVEAADITWARRCLRVFIVYQWVNNFDNYSDILFIMSIYEQVKWFQVPAKMPWSTVTPLLVSWPPLTSSLISPTQRMQKRLWNVRMVRCTDPIVSKILLHSSLGQMCTQVHSCNSQGSMDIVQYLYCYKCSLHSDSSCQRVSGNIFYYILVYK